MTRPSSIRRRLILGALLTGGRSSRMGTDKAALQSNAGKSFFQIAIARLEALDLPLVVSGNCSITHDHLVIEDLVADAGPISGVAACLDHAQRHDHHACLFSPIDVPDLQTDHLRSLIDQYHQSPKITVAQTDRLEPLIAIYPVSALDPLMHQLQTGRRSLFRWLQTIDHQTVPLPPAACRNVNTPQDLT